MKFINLTKGKVTALDDEDYERLAAFKWTLSSTGYAVRSQTVGTKEKTILMHREILNADEEAVVDHADGNPLNNAKSNLRICTHRLNSYNARTKKGTASPYKGVCWDKESRMWRADIRPNRKNIYLGRFKNQEDAARAYNEAAKIHFGEFAWLNTVVEV